MKEGSLIEIEFGKFPIFPSLETGVMSSESSSNPFLDRIAEEVLFPFPDFPTMIKALLALDTALACKNPDHFSSKY